MLVVCHGNVCRSPVAARVLRTLLPPDTVRTGGLKTTDGRVAAKKARDYAGPLGYGLEAHRSARVTQADVDWADVILYMDGSNLRRLREFPGAEAKADCLARYVGASRIPDPNYLKDTPERAFIFETVVRACRAFAAAHKNTPGG